MSYKLKDYDKISEIYISEKKKAYSYYEEFSKLSREEKLRYLSNIYNTKYEEDILNDIIVATFLFPNDYDLLRIGGPCLIDNTNVIMELLGVNRELIKLKSIEFQLFKTSKLLDNGIFTIEEMRIGPFMGDPIYKEYVEKIQNTKNSRK